MVGKNLGISTDNITISVALLNIMLANESILLLKTMKSHWDIHAVAHHALHKMFNKEAIVLTKLVNGTAERIRALGGVPFSTAAQMLRNTTLTEEASPYENARVAVEALTVDHEFMARNLRNAAHEIDGATSEDIGTIDFLTKAIQLHEGFASDLGVFIEGLTVLVPNPH
jgi:starvation-inducible DNA-binding protein